MVDGAHPGNSVGVAIPQPRVEGHSDSTLGIYIIRWSYSVRVAVSRRRYHSRNSSLCYYAYIMLPIGNKVIFFWTGVAGLFLPPTADFLYLWLFSLPQGRRGWGGGEYPRARSRDISRHTRTHRGEALKNHKSFCSFLGWYSHVIRKYTRQVTPTAKRNSVRVARLVGRLPRVADFARNPGLGKRNSYRVARGAHRPQWDNHTWL